VSRSSQRSLKLGCSKRMHANFKGTHLRWLHWATVVGCVGGFGWMCYASHPSIAVPIPAPVTEALTAPIPALPPEFPSEPVGQVSQAQVNLAALVRHLKQRGVKMYGADWCPFCQRQKAMFGDTFREINYIECNPKSPKGQPALCEKANIQAYPTWEINGRLFQGLRTPEELAFLSGFPGRL
jgi:hypothetical protein